MDAKNFSWHAGTGNTNALGVDITQSPEEDELQDMLDLGFDVEVVDNPTGRGDDRVLTLDPTTAQSMRELILDAHHIWGIPLKVPRKPNGDYYHGVLEKSEHKKWDGFLGHHTSPETSGTSRRGGSRFGIPSLTDPHSREEANAKALF